MCVTLFRLAASILCVPVAPRRLLDDSIRSRSSIRRQSRIGLHVVAYLDSVLAEFSATIKMDLVFSLPSSDRMAVSFLFYAPSLGSD